MRAGLTRMDLAHFARTSTSAVSAYERGVRSPTVATLDRLLQACGLQLRPDLEPYISDIDAAVDALLAGPVTLPSCASLVEALEAAGVTWAFDGGTALALHGMHLEGHDIEIVVTADERTRRFLHPIGLPTFDPEGEPLWDNWMDVDVAKLGVCSAWTRFGPLAVRVTDALPTPVRMSLEGKEVPVLGLLEIEAGNPQLGDLLARLRERRTVAP